MANTLEFSADRLSKVTAEEVSRFADSVDIRDAEAFAAELEVFVHERLKLSSGRPGIEAALAGKAAALRAGIRWTPVETDIQRGRAAMLEVYDRPHNLPLPQFALLANKVRQQVYKDIAAGRLLALNVGPRGRKLPDWQLDPVKQRLTQAVLQGAAGIDAWTLYRALSEPLQVLQGRPPVDAVTQDSVDAVAGAVFNVLGVH